MTEHGILRLWKIWPSRKQGGYSLGGLSMLSLYHALIYFMIFSVFGWILEVVFHAVTLGKVINRGFLNGPYCPVYGCGVLVVMYAVHLCDVWEVFHLSGGAHDLKDAFVMFLFGFVLATVVELLAGWLLDVCFHMRWWDYSDRPFNLHGYICLEFSIIWGLCISFVVRMVLPVLQNWQATVFRPVTAGYVIITVVYIIFAMDIGVSIAIVIGLNKYLKELDEIRDSLRRFSDRLSTGIGDSTIKTTQTVESGRVQAALARMEFESDARPELERKKAEMEKRLSGLRDKLTRHRIFGYGRILRAFPGAEHRYYRETLRDLIMEIGNR